MRRKIIALAGISAVVALLAGACSGSDDPSTVGTGVDGTSTVPVRAVLTEPEGWTAMGDSPLEGRANAATAWTGSELLVWRGNGAFNDGGGGEPARTDGAAYDPATDEWRPMAESPLPPAGNVLSASSYASAWTGTELLVWGGPGPAAAAYDPATDRWRRLDPGPLGTRNQFGHTWTGTELVVYGGATPIRDQDEPYDEGPLDDGAAYDPVTDTWRELPPTGIHRVDPKVTWTGDRIVVLLDATPKDRSVGIGLVLDDDGTGWRRTATPPMSEFRAAVWTPSGLVAMGPLSRHLGDDDGDDRPDGIVATYDPTADAWARLDEPTEFDVAAPGRPSMVWSGREVLVVDAPFWFGATEEEPVLRAAALDPASGTWRSVDTPPLSWRGGSSSAWTGTELLLWGGESSTGYTSDPYADGARYRPGPGR